MTSRACALSLKRWPRRTDGQAASAACATGQRPERRPALPRNVNAIPAQPRHDRPADGQPQTGAASPVLACCRPATRSTIVRALGQAGQRPAGDIVAMAAEAGYDIAGLRPQLEAMAAAN